MPGPYAHITLLHELMRPGKVEKIFAHSSEFATVVADYFPYCALGAVSPDYPNLVQGDAAAATLADAMHYIRTCDMITSGILRVRSANGATRNKQLAWLLGYCAHVAADVTIHPVVQAKVGIYAENQRQHRICEMNQDSYIYRRMNLGDIGASDNFSLTIMQCGDADGKNRLDRDIATLWEGMFLDVHPESFIAEPADVDSWHREFVAMVAGSAASDIRMLPLAGVISAKIGMAYPAFDMVDQQFVAEQIVPSEIPHRLHYDEIFDHAAVNAATLWRVVEQAVCSINPVQLTFGNWNLDTGRDELGKLVFW